MQKNSTPTQNAVTSSSCVKSQSKPRRATIDFLKQFARVYHFEAHMSCSFGGMMMN